MFSTVFSYAPCLQKYVKINFYRFSWCYCFGVFFKCWFWRGRILCRNTTGLIISCEDAMWLRLIIWRIFFLMLGFINFWVTILFVIFPRQIMRFWRIGWSIWTWSVRARIISSVISILILIWSFSRRRIRRTCVLGSRCCAAFICGGPFFILLFSLSAFSKQEFGCLNA